MSFTSTYNSLSVRGWQSPNQGAQQSYFYNSIQSGPSTQSTLFGTAVSTSDLTLSGNSQLATIGAYLYNNPNVVGNPEGLVSFTNIVSSPQIIFGTDSNHRLGISVAMSRDANYAIAGSETSPAGTGTSSVKIYVADGSYNYTEQTSINNPLGNISNENYGRAVAINNVGNIVAVGDTSANNTGGAVYLYSRSGAIWSNVTTLTPANLAVGLNFGSSLSINDAGNVVAIGANGSSTLTGAVYIFANVSGTWTEQAEIKPSTSANNDIFGASVALTGNATHVVVGSPNTSSAGNAYVFSNTANVWTQYTELTPSSNTITFTNFGLSVATNEDASCVIVGDQAAQLGANFVGAICVYNNVASTYTQVQEIVNPVTSNGGSFGFGLSTTSSGDSLLIGDPNYTESGTGNRGAVYRYTSIV